MLKRTLVALCFMPATLLYAADTYPNKTPNPNAPSAPSSQMPAPASGPEEEHGGRQYTLSNIQSVVSNSEKCAGFHEALQQLSKNSIELAFKKGSHKNDLKAKDASGQLLDLKHTTIKQTEEEGVFHRIGIGSFEFQGEKIDYLVSIAANPSNPDHKYLYPIILESHHAQCYYTALVKPSEETTSKFKDNIGAGHASKGADMTR